MDIVELLIWAKLFASRISISQTPDSDIIFIDTDEYADDSEIAVVVNGVEYDAKNLTFNISTADNGYIIVKKLEV